MGGTFMIYHFQFPLVKIILPFAENAKWKYDFYLKCVLHVMQTGILVYYQFTAMAEYDIILYILVILIFAI